MKRIVVLNGIHTAGKTTLAQHLVENTPGLSYFEEIGGRLRLELLATGAKFNVLRPNYDFDFEIMHRELERDKNLLLCKDVPIIETWHIGNLAYVAVRSPEIFSHYLRIFENQLTLFKPTPILVSINQSVFRQRVKERNDPKQIDSLLDFYKRLLEQIIMVYEKFNIEYSVHENDSALGTSVGKLREKIVELGIVSDLL